MIDFAIQDAVENHLVRRGQVKTSHGMVQTPAAFPWMIDGSLGGLSAQQCQAMGVQGLALDVLPLSVQPGIQVIQQAGGLHQFLSCALPMLSFSGLFPAVDHLKKNMAQLGIRYQAPYTKAYQRMTPTQADEMANIMNADFQLPMFQTVDYYAPVDDLQEEIKINQSWQKQAKSDWLIMMGGGLHDLRAEMASVHGKSAVLVANLPMDDLIEYRRILQASLELLPQTILRVAVADNEEQLLLALSVGIDIVIWRHALKAANHGTAYSKKGPFSLRQADYATAEQPLIDGYRPSYLHYLHHESSPAAINLLTIHNLSVVTSLLKKWRLSIGSTAETAAYNDLQRAITLLQ